MSPELITTLKEVVSGKVAVSGDALYTTASNMLFGTIAPSVVVQPADSQDAARVISFVAEHDIPFAIRSGGHGTVAARLPKGILLIDLSAMKQVTVLDEEKAIVKVEAGTLWHEAASELHAHNLAISSGDTRTVGVGGLATGGGLGWMVRKYGPVVDNIISAEVITAKGEILQVSESEHSDLFWAIRGGGSNFGLVTSFTFQAHRLDGIYVATILYPIEEAEKAITGWRDAMRAAPAELTTMLMTFPGMDGSPASVMIHACFAGNDVTAADAAYQPFLQLGTIRSQEIKAMPYKDILEDGMPIKGIRVVVHDAFLKEFSNAAIHDICAVIQKEVPILQIRHLSGVMNERPADATAFSHRDSEVLIVNPTFVAPNASDKEIDAKLDAWRAIEPYSQGVYLNLITEDTGTEVAAAYPPATLARLRRIKAVYDPQNIFRANYNITPQAG